MSTRAFPSSSKKELTFVAHQVYVSPVLRNTNAMVLHARTPTNIPHHEDLDVFIFRLLCGRVARGNEVAGPLGKVDGEGDEVSEKNDEQTTGNGGEDKGQPHGERA